MQSPGSRKGETLVSNTPKKALITGISGQDGSYLAELLLQEGYEVTGLVRRRSQGMPENIAHLFDRITLVYGDLADASSLAHVLRDIRPDEIYNLAAQSVPRESWRYPLYTLDVTALGAARLLEAAYQHLPGVKFYQASTSEIFGDAVSGAVDETTPLRANNPYGVAKLAAHLMAHVYRTSYQMFICCGILFNHESPRRSPDFVTRKVSLGAAAAKLGTTTKARNEEGQPILTPDGKLALGNLSATRDWGHARDYARAMWLMLQHHEPNDYVIATGTLHSIEDLCATAFAHVGLNWRERVTTDARFLRPTEIGSMWGNTGKAKHVLGWESTTTFEQLVNEMVEADLELLRQR